MPIHKTQRTKSVPVGTEVLDAAVVYLEESEVRRADIYTSGRAITDDAKR